MEITLVQLEVRYKDTKANLALLREQLLACENVGEVVLVPELFTSGYLFDRADEIHQLAVSFRHVGTIAELQSLAAEFDITLVAGLAEREGEDCYNSAVVINSDGIESVYRKIAHTNIDKRYFSRGNKLVPRVINTFKNGGYLIRPSIPSLCKSI